MKVDKDGLIRIYTRPLRCWSSCYYLSIPRSWVEKYKMKIGEKIAIVELGEDLNEWSESANTVIDKAKDTWIRHYAKRGDKGYRIIVASADMGEPKWPGESWEELIEIAFKGKIIDDPEHAIFKKLRGELT